MAQLSMLGVDVVAEWESGGADRRAIADALGVDCEINAILAAIAELTERRRADIEPMIAATLLIHCSVEGIAMVTLASEERVIALDLEAACRDAAHTIAIGLTAPRRPAAEVT
ncbi:MAG: hypothetical protein QM662_14115 [Gordonia sp. (in: high G+C Gram-positive bacteria)]